MWYFNASMQQNEPKIQIPKVIHIKFTLKLIEN